jgi:hypothetical protein
MEKYKETEDVGPSHYDYNFDFDIDFRLKPHEYFLIIPYVLFILPFVWACEVCVNVYHKLISYKSHVKNNTDSKQKFNGPAGPCCLWPRHSSV